MTYIEQVVFISQLAKEMKNYKSNESCEVCGECRDGYVCYHHLVSRGAGGSDHPFNLMSLCQKHHNEVHSVGLARFVHNYNIDLILKGWELCKFDGWLPPAECYK